MEIQQVAQNTFTVSALLLTATIVLLNYSWKRLKLLIATMPPDKRQIRVNLRSVTDANEHYKYEFILAQLFSCVLFAFSLFCALSAVVIMSGLMVGDTSGIYAQDNFEFAIVSMRVGVICLFVGMFSHSLGYAVDLLSLYRGELSLATTKLEELPKRKPIGKENINIFLILNIGFFIIIMLVELFVPYNQWVKMAMALVALILLLILVNSIAKSLKRIQPKRESSTS